MLRKSADADDPVGGVTNVQLSVELEHAVIVAQVTTYRVGYVWTSHSPRYLGSGGGWRPDPLLPIDIPFDVPPDVTQPLWISVTVSRQARAGNHTATIHLSGNYSNGHGFTLNVPLTIHVFHTVLPDLSQSNIGSAWSGSWGAGAFKAYYGPNFDWNASKHEWYDMMIAHRMPPDSIYLSSLREENDYTYMASRGVKWFAILDVTTLMMNDPLPGHTGNVQGECANYTDEYAQRLVETLRPMVAFLESKDLLDRAYVYGFDENPVSCEPQVRKLFGATKRAYPHLKTAAVLNWSPMPVDLPVDIWILQYAEYNETDARPWIEAGKQQWQYHCIEPNDLAALNTFIERPTYQPRLLFWLAALTKLQTGAPTGWLYYAMNLWEPCNNPLCSTNYTERKPLIQNYSSPFCEFPVGNYIWQRQHMDDIFANGDGQFLYPCADGKPCGSIRLSALRDGLEDWDGLFWNLDPAQQGIELLQEVVRSPRDWTFPGSARIDEIRTAAARAQHRATNRMWSENQ